MKNRIMLVDKETGEVLEENVLLIGSKPYIKRDKGFVKVFVAFLRDIVESKKIAGKAIRLLFYMLNNMDYNSYTIRIIPRYAQKELKITKDTYYRWIKDLIGEKIITKVDRYTYKLNPYIAVKGTREKALRNDIEKLKRTKDNTFS